jgi:uracil-DNA glycosylase
MANRQDLAAELLQIVDSLATAIALDGERKRPLSYLCGSKNVDRTDKPCSIQKTPVDVKSTLPGVREELGDCRRCPLHKTRQNLVFGEGNPQAEVVFVGEAPGADEDRQGRPFVGRAGQLLTKIIEAMGLKREEVYICNILKCRPPGNRNPLPEEILTCEPFLVRQLAAIAPQVICALGTFAAHTLLKNEVPITVLRGRFHDYHGIAVMPTYHPAYLLRNPSAKKQVWEDVQQIMKRLKSGETSQTSRG